MKETKISIVTVTYNAVKDVEKTILSVLNQTYPEIEYIVVDGGSTDGTIDIIKKYSNKIDQWISEPDNGIFDAMNKGLAIATGEWIAFMNAGDYYVSTDIIQDIFMSTEMNKYSVIYGDMIAVRSNASEHIKAFPFYESKNRFVPMGFSHQSTFVKADLARNICFDLEYKVAADYNMIYKIYKSGGLFYYYENVISAVTFDGFSSKNRRLQLQEVARITGCKSKFLTFLQIKYYLLRYKVIQIRDLLK